MNPNTLLFLASKLGSFEKLTPSEKEIFMVNVFLKLKPEERDRLLAQMSESELETFSCMLHRVNEILKSFSGRRPEEAP